MGWIKKYLAIFNRIPGLIHNSSPLFPDLGIKDRLGNNVLLGSKINLDVDGKSYIVCYTADGCYFTLKYAGYSDYHIPIYKVSEHIDGKGTRLMGRVVE